MIRPILKYGDQLLQDAAQPADAVPPEIVRLIDDMIETMYAAPGVGLAAPQIGVSLRIFVADISIGRDPQGLMVFVNPVFVERDGMQLEEEGCLSVPGFNATVVRPSMSVLACSIAIANPSDSAERSFNVVMPTTWPLASTSGPPLLPGLIAASVCT
jgi:peptide deformylase